MDVDKTITQVKNDLELGFNTPSTRLKSTYYFFPDDQSLTTIQDFALYSTQVKMKEADKADTSTWTEIEEDNFDIFSNVPFQKKYNVKAKIKTVSKYNPKIVIE